MAKRTPTRRGASGRKRVSQRTRAKSRRKPIGAWLGALRHRWRSRLGRQADDVWGLVLVVISVLMTLAFFGLAGPVGHAVAATLRLLFGLWALGVPLAFAGLGVVLILGRPHGDYARLPLGVALAFVGSLALFHLMTGTVSLAHGLGTVMGRGGAVGSLLAFPLRRVLGLWGAFVVLVAVTGIGVLVITRTSVRQAAGAAVEMTSALRAWARGVRAAQTPSPSSSPVVEAGYTPKHRAKAAASARRARQTASDSRPKRGSPAPRAPAPAPAHPSVLAEGYRKPPLELLQLGGGEGQSRRSLEENARELQETLEEHGVDARLTKIVPGPTVTRYEIELAAGVKVSRVTGLSHDIAYALATPDVRILAPIPGRSAIGVEVPNRKRRLVTLGDVLRSPEGEAAGHPLEVGLGIDISGRPRLLNLSEMPHLLIAGATGAGKSSCINALVTTLLVKTTPDDVRLILVDPKRVELNQYNQVPHLLTRVIVNPKKAADALQWAVREMDRRYDLIADARARDIIGYRERFDAGELDEEAFDRFPYVVLVVDELNDLMMVAGREVEEAIVRIAQMARAVGIHLVIATQRPSVDVITGVIKANIPSRLAFSVASQADSRVIIDQGGAEKLVGLGDMLVVTAQSAKPERIQGAWVSEEEIRAVVEWSRQQRPTRYQDEVMEEAGQEAREAEVGEDEEAELVRQAIELVVRSQLGSTSMLQRKLRVGFARAGRLMDILERKGVVGPSEGSKARAVLMTSEELEESMAASPTPSPSG
ncbi:MAG: DNA translocase FtsK [Actinomycetota bacterium]|nr:DNA translocase FtsK [Actinomycetota bacterium]